MRHSGSPVSEILTFTLLNSAKNFFDLIPLAAWIATCILIWELFQTGEWDLFSILGITNQNFLYIALMTGLFLSTFSFIGREIIMLPVIKKAEAFRLDKFKNKSGTNLFNRWFILRNNFFHFDYLNLDDNSGHGASLIFNSNDFKMQSKISSKTFSINKPTITLHDATMVDITNNTATKIGNYIATTPELFLQLKMHKTTPSLKRQLKNLFIAKKISPHFPFNQEIGKFLSRMLEHFQSCIYILMTLCLFFVFFHYRYLRWFAISLPYPFLLISTALAEFGLQKNVHFFVIFFPYIASLIFIFVCLHYLKK